MIDQHQLGEQNILDQRLIYHVIVFHKTYRPTVNCNLSFYNECWTTSQRWKVCKKYSFLFSNKNGKHIADSDIFTHLYFLLKIYN